jgi:hypothetical protein
MPQPDNAVRIIREGIRPAEGAGPIMPGFAAALTEQQLTTLLEFLRSQFAQQTPWPDVAASVHRTLGNPTQQARSAQ